jgi:hypothetical protein
MTGSIACHATMALATEATTTDKGPPITSQTIGSFHQGRGIEAKGIKFSMAGSWCVIWG